MEKNLTFKVQDLIIPAYRYYVGRMTIAACCFAEELARNWRLLPVEIQNIIKRELEADFIRDDESRANGEKWHPLGWDCDREAWEKVREAYRDS